MLRPTRIESRWIKWLILVVYMEIDVTYDIVFVNELMCILIDLDHS